MISHDVYLKLFQLMQKLLEHIHLQFEGVHFSGLRHSRPVIKSHKLCGGSDNYMMQCRWRHINSMKSFVVQLEMFYHENYTSNVTTILHEKTCKRALLVPKKPDKYKQQ